MKLNADFTRRAVVHSAVQDFVPSPMPGVERLMLDRIGDEVARATTIVRYAPGSSFSPHTHDGGEEFLVLDGVFQDEHGDSPAGTYVRNPPGSRHQPGSEPGCTIFVKLRQFASDDDRHVVVDTTTPSMAPLVGRPGAVGRVIHEDERELVRVEEWAPNARIEFAPRGGIEILCLDGGFSEGGESFGRWSWLRLPDGAPLSALAGARGCRVWMKEGHLRNPLGLS
ncbi:MAG TPA: cupin domain-containing protein [Amaricoccus sp.]|uniref:cupin domain-containing protein n=1 Tax=Amaricoccus sp. TaxID=1872485 RepID=UPI002CC1C219|nr:cupin domain-containing protein [Amaricoccus sp.]HMQ93475.1 cupin domain-containing protein [Amaricoccus sp.]HMR53664.1 cupin domain-containing protein [Amaricoccus sp.]HMU00738.1 cupin domain-containing protein [Amaricoccus sp.]